MTAFPALRLLAAALFFATQQDASARWAGFPVFVWRLEYAGRALPAALVEPFGGTNVERGEEAPWVLEGGLDFYVGHAPGRDELHVEREDPWYAELWQRFYDERDTGALSRRPCLSEPETYARLAAQLARSVRARGTQTGLGVSLGDEVGLTAWGGPLDLCASPACRAAWSRFLPGDLARHGVSANAAEVPYVDTDAARRALTAGDAGLVGPWLARRRFHQELVVELLGRLAAESRALAPGAPVGLFGLSGRTAFGGVAVERILPQLDFVECYRVADARELLYTLRGPGQRSVLTVFPEGSPDGSAWTAWEHWLRGGDGLVVWCDRDLERDAAYRERLARAVADLRRLRRRLPSFRPLPGGVALVHSPDSLTYTWLKESLHDGATWPKRFASYHEEHAARERALRAWLRLFEDCGQLPGSLPLATIGRDTARRFPLLVASHVAIVGERERAALASYLAGGGRLLLQGPFAERDAWGRRPETDVESALREGAPQAVLRVPEAVERAVAAYLEERVAGGSGAARGLRAWAAGRLTEAGVPAPAYRLRVGESAQPFLAATVAGARPGERIVAALPNLPSAQERAGLVELPLTLELDEGWRAEWIHPRPAADGTPRLPAGDAAVFVLRAP